MAQDLAPQEETIEGWLRRTSAKGRASRASDMTGAAYAVAIAGMGLTYNQAGPLIGVTGRQALRYADFEFVPEWTAREVRRMREAFREVAESLVAADEIDAGKVPAGMPPTSYLACIALAMALRAERPIVSGPARIYFHKNDEAPLTSV